MVQSSYITTPILLYNRRCVLVDKLDKLPAAEVTSSLLAAGLSPDAASKLLATLAVTDFAGLEAAMG